MLARLDRIIIIGGGIGGLGTALALQRRGYRVSIYERAREMREIGAGIAISPNGRRALRDLGIDAALEALSSCIVDFSICDYATAEVKMVHGNENTRKYGMDILQVHRGDLHMLLKQAVEANDPGALHPGHEFIRLEQDAEAVSVFFANGASDRAEMVIGADGNASAVRSFLFPEEPPRFNGQVAFRAVIPNELVPALIRERKTGMYPCPKRFLLHYPLRGEQLMNLVAIGQANAWEEEGWSIPATNEEFAQHYSDLAPVLLSLIRSIPAGSLFKWGLRDREPLTTWTIGRLTMIGDAAHPMTPFIGQGACLALEDGLVLARAVAASATVEEALGRYEAARKLRGTNVQLWSRQQGEAMQNPSLPFRTPEELGIYDYDPATAPV